MPLIQSGKKQSMGKNIATEMHAGKPQKQAIAIAYNVMRKNRGKMKKMADGGSTDNDQSQGMQMASQPGQQGDANARMQASMQKSYDLAPTGKATYDPKTGQAHGFAKGGKIMPHEAVALHKSRSNNQKDWQHTNEFSEGGMTPDEENMGRGYDKEYSHTEPDHNEDLDPGSASISEAPQGYVDPEHSRRPKDSYMPAQEDLGRNMAHGGHVKQNMDDHLEGKQDEVHHMAHGGMGLMHPKHIAVIIHSKHLSHGGMAKHGKTPKEYAEHAEETHGESTESGYGGRYPVPADDDGPGADEATDVTGSYFDGGYTGADGGEVPSEDDGDEGLIGKIKGFLQGSAGKDYQMHVGDKNKAKAVSGAFSGAKPTPTPGYGYGGYADGGEVDQMGADEDTDDDSEVESLPFEDDDSVNKNIMKGYHSLRENTEGQHDRKNRHGVIKNIMRGLHRKHFGT